MRNIFIFAAAIAAPVAIAAAPVEAQIDQREDRQQSRIDNGIANGSLTACAARQNSSGQTQKAGALPPRPFDLISDDRRSTRPSVPQRQS